MDKNNYLSLLAVGALLIAVGFSGFYYGQRFSQIENRQADTKYEEMRGVNEIKKTILTPDNVKSDLTGRVIDIDREEELITVIFDVTNLVGSEMSADNHSTLVKKVRIVEDTILVPDTDYNLRMSLDDMDYWDLIHVYTRQPIAQTFQLEVIEPFMISLISY